MIEDDEVEVTDEYGSVITYYSLWQLNQLMKKSFILGVLAGGCIGAFITWLSFFVGGL
jgi:hypothetical protein